VGVPKDLPFGLLLVIQRLRWVLHLGQVLVSAQPLLAALLRLLHWLCLNISGLRYAHVKQAEQRFIFVAMGLFHLTVAILRLFLFLMLLSILFDLVQDLLDL
jgi:hypothetical protein